MDDDAELWKGLLGWAHAHETETGTSRSAGEVTRRLRETRP